MDVGHLSWLVNHNWQAARENGKFEYSSTRKSWTDRRDVYMQIKVANDQLGKKIDNRKKSAIVKKAQARDVKSRYDAPKVL